MQNKSVLSMGNAVLALRLVIGWTYFSAFWRRLILENKLDPEAAGYIGEKFNHFLPNALFIKPLIQYLVENPEALFWNMWIFTLVEGIVGLLLILGYKTRLMSIAVFFLAMGILLGSGWIGTTCLDEWQIGVLGLAGGFSLFQAGSGKISLDYFFHKNQYIQQENEWNITSYKKFSPYFLGFSFFILFVTLFTNQVFHGGVYGTLHNKSVKPQVEISNLTQQQNKVSFDVMRIEGADVYGSFLIQIDFHDHQNEIIKSLDMKALANLDHQQISNYYVAKVAPHKHSLVLPLGAKANLNFHIENKIHKVVLTDISGLQWEQTITNL
ncbi:quinol oxidase [Empedobacter brevis]|uniref:Quinol oxidase n=2 Tax=Empedobacter brevis TaxID=247 RepID=A0AAJ1QDK7_9FLAO|nr:TQO small subunit DoxD [Empedobacter brevis]MDM1072103.1 quinol oxidase [Empedobacter brevis]